MDLWAVGVFSLIVFLSALALIWWHLRVWRAAQNQRLEPRDFDYRRRQFRRRMQTSAMLAILAVGLFLGRCLFLLPVPPLVPIVYWSVVVLLILWMGLLACVDAASTALHFGRMRQEVLLEQTRLQAQLRQIKSHRGNGQAEKPRRSASDSPD